MYGTQETRSGFDMSKALTYDNPPNLSLIKRTVLMPRFLPKYPVQLRRSKRDIFSNSAPVTRSHLQKASGLGFSCSRISIPPGVMRRR